MVPRNKLPGLSVSQLGLGTGRLASLGAGYTTNDAKSLLGVAADCGINLIDTADSYGSTDCESLLGRLLQDFPEIFQVATKAGYPYAEFPRPLRSLNQFGKKALQKLGRRPCFSESYLATCIDGSLRRLRKECLDIFYLHDPSQQVMEEDGWRKAVTSALQSGKIRCFGISSPDPEVQDIAARDPLCEILQIPLHLGVRAIPETSKPIVANHVFGHGLNSPLVAEIAQEVGCSPRSLLLAYAASRKGVACVLTGTGRASHLRENAQAMNIVLDDAVKEKLAAISMANGQPSAEPTQISSTPD
jgi:aryl-alcohol dehydrogenase-like predicted oxidoreductase